MSFAICSRRSVSAVIFAAVTAMGAFGSLASAASPVEIDNFNDGTSDWNHTPRPGFTAADDNVVSPLTGSHDLRLSGSRTGGAGGFPNILITDRAFTTSISTGTLTHFAFRVTRHATETLIISVVLHDDDDNSGAYTNGTDNEHSFAYHVAPGPGVEIVHIPLSSFASWGGNNIADFDPSGNGGLVGMSLLIFINNAADYSADIHIDDLAFTDGAFLPVSLSRFELE